MLPNNFFLLVVLNLLTISSTHSQTHPRGNTSKSDSFLVVGLIPQITIGVGEIKSTQAFTTDRRVIAQNIKAAILQALQELKQAKNYDFQVASDSTKMDLVIQGTFSIESILGDSFNHQENQKLSLELVNRESQFIATAMNVDTVNPLLKDKTELVRVVSNIVDFFIYTRICTHTTVLPIPDNFNNELESVVLKTHISYPIQSKLGAKVNTLLTNMFIDVQSHQPSFAKSFNFRVSNGFDAEIRPDEITVQAIISFRKENKAQTWRQNNSPMFKEENYCPHSIIIKNFFSQRHNDSMMFNEGYYVLKLTFTKGGEEFFRSKELFFDSTKMDQGNYLEFITKTFPQIRYLRSQKF